jgi:hypothetical protein
MAKMGDSDNVFSRREWNRHVEVADWYFREKALGDVRGRGRRGHDSNVITVKNSSGVALPMGSVVEFSDYLLNDNELAQRMIRLDAVESTGKDRWGILNLPLKAGERGACQISGGCVALVNVTSTSHTHARVVSGETHLVSDYYGDAVILDNGGTAGTKLCPVNLRPAFKIVTGVVSQSGGILSGASGNVLLSNGETRSVKNPFGDVDESAVVMVSEVSGILQLWYVGTGGGGGGTDDRIWITATLTEAMGHTSAFVAAGTVVDAIGTGAPAAAASVTLHDPRNIFVDCKSGASCIAVNWGTAGSPEYRILWCSRVVERMKLRCTTAICATDTGDMTSRLAFVETIPCGDFMDSPGEDYVVTNPAAHAAMGDTSGQTDGDFVWVERVGRTRDGNGKWQYKIVECKQHTVIWPKEQRVLVDEQTGAAKLQWRGPEGSGEVCKPLSDWFDVGPPLKPDCPE